MFNLKNNIEKVKNRVGLAAIAAGRSPQSVELIAVSKYKPFAAVEEAYSEGIRKFGENYVEELMEKAEMGAHLDIHWVFIGQLQSNKIKRLMSRVSEIHTVASDKHLRYISEYLESHQKNDFPVYLHVNVEGESQKFGMAPAEAIALANRIPLLHPRVKLEGIFSIPSQETSALAATGVVPEVFHQLKELAEQVGHKKLSLGMSLDLESAIKAGSTCVRVGTDIFGERSL